MCLLEQFNWLKVLGRCYHVRVVRPGQKTRWNRDIYENGIRLPHDFYDKLKPFSRVLRRARVGRDDCQGVRKVLRIIELDHWMVYFRGVKPFVLKHQRFDVL